MSSRVLQWVILRLPLHLTVVHRPTNVLCPWAAFTRGPNKMKDEVSQKLDIFPCPLCLLSFCFPWAAFSVPSSSGFCFVPLPSSPLGCQTSLLASLQETLTTDLLSSLESLPPLLQHSLTGHPSAFPGPPHGSFGTYSLVRSSVSWTFFWVHLPQP